MKLRVVDRSRGVPLASLDPEEVAQGLARLAGRGVRLDPRAVASLLRAPRPPGDETDEMYLRRTVDGELVQPLFAPVDAKPDKTAVSVRFARRTLGTDIRGNPRAVAPEAPALIVGLRAFRAPGEEAGRLTFAAAGGVRPAGQWARRFARRFRAAEGAAAAPAPPSAPPSKKELARVAADVQAARSVRHALGQLRPRPPRDSRPVVHRARAAILLNVVKDKLGTERYRAVASAVAPRGITFARSEEEVLSALDAGEKRLVQAEMRRRAAEDRARRENTCPHVKLARRFRQAKAQRARDDAFAALRAYLPHSPVSADTGEYLDCTNCGFPVMCPHVAALEVVPAADRDLLDAPSRRAALRPFILEGVRGSRGGGFHEQPCRICGETLEVVINEDAAVVHSDLDEWRKGVWAAATALAARLRFAPSRRAGSAEKLLRVPAHQFADLAARALAAAYRPADEMGLGLQAALGAHALALEQIGAGNMVLVPGKSADSSGGDGAAAKPISRPADAARAMLEHLWGAFSRALAEAEMSRQHLAARFREAVAEARRAGGTALAEDDVADPRAVLIARVLGSVQYRYARAAARRDGAVPWVLGETAGGKRPTADDDAAVAAAAEFVRIMGAAPEELMERGAPLFATLYEPKGGAESADYAAFRAFELEPPPFAAEYPAPWRGWAAPQPRPLDGHRGTGASTAMPDYAPITYLVDEAGKPHGRWRPSDAGEMGDLRADGSKALWSELPKLDAGKAGAALAKRLATERVLRFFAARCPEGGFHDFGRAGECQKCGRPRTGAPPAAWMRRYASAVPSPIPPPTFAPVPRSTVPPRPAFTYDRSLVKAAAAVSCGGRGNPALVMAQMEAVGVTQGARAAEVARGAVAMGADAPPPPSAKEPRNDAGTSAPLLSGTREAARNAGAAYQALVQAYSVARFFDVLPRSGQDNFPGVRAALKTLAPDQRKHVEAILPHPAELEVPALRHTRMYPLGALDVGADVARQAPRARSDEPLSSLPLEGVPIRAEALHDMRQMYVEGCARLILAAAGDPAPVGKETKRANRHTAVGGDVSPSTGGAKKLPNEDKFRAALACALRDQLIRNQAAQLRPEPGDLAKKAAGDLGGAMGAPAERPDADAGLMGEPDSIWDMDMGDAGDDNVSGAHDSYVGD